MTLWSFNIFVCIACIAMFYINLSRAEKLMKERYPEVCFGRTSALTAIITAIKIVLVSICPILNLLMLYTSIFRDTEMIEAVVKESYDKYHKNDHTEANL